VNREIEWINSASEISALENCWLVSLETEIFYSTVWKTLVSTSEVSQVCVKSCQNTSRGSMNYKMNKQGEGVDIDAALKQFELQNSH